MATSNEMLNREKDIHDALGRGLSVTVMCDEIAVKYKVSPRSIHNQYLQIVKDMKNVILESREDLRAELMARNNYIYKKSIDNGQYKTALDANTAQAKLAGLADKHDAEPEKPKMVVVKERDNSTPLAVVKDSAVNGDK